MKSLTFYIVFVAVIIFTMPVFAQYPVPGGYDVNNTLTRFEGTWRWVNGQDTVWIYMQKQKINYSEIPYDADKIVGWHKYKKGNVIVESNYQFTGTSYNQQPGNVSLYCGNKPSIDPNFLEGMVTDITKAKKVDLTLTLNAGQDQLQWKTTNPQGTKLRPYNYGYTLPTQMTLIKQ